MGTICAGRANIEQNDFIRQDTESNTTKKLQFKAGQFVQENLGSFFLIYSLHDAPIGSGAFAEVWLCTHKRTNEVRAVKILHKSGVTEEDIRLRSVFLEVEILKTLDHPNILKVYEYFEDETDYYIVMEYCPGGDIFDKLESEGPFTEKYAARSMKFLLTGLNYLHSRQVVHRDIKPENLLITNSKSATDFNIKIIDFNVATVKESKKNLYGVTGTTDYMAPEVFRGIYDEKCDIWSAGIVLYLMMSCTLPFPSPNDEEAERAICMGKFSFPNQLFGKVSKECKNFISQLLTKNPSARPSALEALKNPWLKLAEEKTDSSTISRTLTRMKTISNTSKLKELFTTFMISQLSSNSNRRLEKIFYEIDKNGDGTIDIKELVEQLSKEMSKKEAEIEAKKIMSLVDTDGSGQVDYSEYLRVTIDEETLLTKENLRKTFFYFDKDNSGTIEKHELIKWLGTGGIIPDSVVNELIEEADLNGDGDIDLEEFENLLVVKLDLDD